MAGKFVCVLLSTTAGRDGLSCGQEMGGVGWGGLCDFLILPWII
jgi:hypothetical protein